VKTSIVIPVWNGRSYLPDCLDAVLGQDCGDIEVIVVDNGSVDGSADLVAEKYPQVRLIRNLSNLGFAGGCNVGLRAAEGDLLVLLNQDTQVQPGWLQTLVDALQSPGVDVAGCKILYPDGTTIQHAGGWIQWPLGLSHHYGSGEEDVGQWDDPREVDYVTGASLAFRRDVLEKVGYLDEEFWPGYFEDADFCFRARDAGFGVLYVPEAVVWHAETTSFADPARRSYSYQRGRLRFVLKHFPPQRFLNEFVSSEKAYQPAAMRGWESGPLQAAYLYAMATASTLLSQYWQADGQLIQMVLFAFRELYERAWEEERVRIKEASPWGKRQSLTSGNDLSDRPPPLKELAFQSGVPVFGSLIARLRTLWYDVAARWVVHDLVKQQNVINQSQDLRIRSLERALASLVESDASLARRIAFSDQPPAVEEAQE